MTLVRTLPFVADGSVALPVYQTFGQQIEALSPTAWTPQRDADFTGMVGAEVQELMARAPAAAKWTALTSARRPTRLSNMTLLFSTSGSAEGMALAGATFPAGDYTKLVVFNVDEAVAATAHLMSDSTTTAIQHTLFYTVNLGGGLRASTGTGVDKQTGVAPAPKGAWGWALCSYDASERTTFLETYGGRAANSAGTADVVPSTACFMGCSTSGASGGLNGKIGPTLILPQSVYSIDGPTDAARLPIRQMLIRYAERAIARLNAGI
ncbi:hypothetical protein [Brevundimonas vesicularis]|uniref:hypothetical protein n=1 Tax=Brevundimonas vesicularis TaxID=41276 RepID=UPI00384E691F